MENIYNFDPACSQHSALTALRLLRSYNHFVVPPETRGMVPLLTSLPPLTSLPTLTSLPPSCLPAYCHHLPLASPQISKYIYNNFIESTSSANSLPCDEARRRGEKRPIPSELKDEKYFERRRRNNQAAKKSRDARRMREDQIAWRACVLEQENASLRAHVAALTQETRALRALLARDDAPTSTTD